jgi:hypothetical protein
VKEGFRRDAWQVLGAEPDSNPGEESSERSARLFNEALEKFDICLLATAGFAGVIGRQQTAPGDLIVPEQSSGVSD